MKEWSSKGEGEIIKEEEEGIWRRSKEEEVGKDEEE